MKILNNSEIAQFNLSSEKAKEISSKAQKFKEILNKNVSNNSNEKVDEKLMDACYQFESMLVGKMFKVMKQTVQNKESLLYGGQAEEIFKDMLYDEYSMLTAKTSDFGLAQQIYDQMTQKTVNVQA